MIPSSSFLASKNFKLRDVQAFIDRKDVVAQTGNITININNHKDDIAKHTFNPCIDKAPLNLQEVCLGHCWYKNSLKFKILHIVTLQARGME